MEITVLGKSPSWPDAGGACSGYLVREEATTLLLDCGNGAFGKLRERLDYAAVDAVVVSHLHADHVLDLVPFAYALTYSPRRTDPPVRPVLHAPAGARVFFRRVVGAWGDERLVEGAFRLEEYETDATPRVGPLSVRFCEVPHFVPTRAVEVAAGAGRLTFGADHAPSDALVAFARDTDLLLPEATLDAPEAAPPRGHLTPAEAGEHARRAGARRLVLTHRSDELDAGAALAAAEQSFGGPVTLAHEGARYAV